MAAAGCWGVALRARRVLKKTQCNRWEKNGEARPENGDPPENNKKSGNGPTTGKIGERCPKTGTLRKRESFPKTVKNKKGLKTKKAGKSPKTGKTGTARKRGTGREREKRGTARKRPARERESLAKSRQKQNLSENGKTYRKREVFSQVACRETTTRNTIRLRCAEGLIRQSCLGFAETTKTTIVPWICRNE